MTALNKQALRETNSKPVKRIDIGIDEYTWLPIEKACPEGKYVLHSDYLSLLDELEAAEKRIAELSASHSKLRDTMAGIHNTIRMDGGYTPLAAILNAAKRAHEESATAAGIGVKGE